MWFEDQAALDALGEKNPMVVPLLTECKLQARLAMVSWVLVLTLSLCSFRPLKWYASVYR